MLIAFACVYFFWGSTYVAIRFGVEVLNPFVLAAVRFLIAGPLMLAWCASRGMKLRQSPRDFAMLAAIGILILAIGNVGVMWAEQYLASGLAALLVAVIPALRRAARIRPPARRAPPRPRLGRDRHRIRRPDHPALSRPPRRPALTRPSAHRRLRHGPVGFRLDLRVNLVPSRQSRGERIRRRPRGRCCLPASSTSL